MRYLTSEGRGTADTSSPLEAARCTSILTNDPCSWSNLNVTLRAACSFEKVMNYIT